MRARTESGGLAFWSRTAREAFRGVFRAWRIRVFDRSSEITLPPVSPTPPPPDATLRRVIRLVKGVTYLLIFWRFKRWCFYRSYALAHVLRPLGVPLEMNLGVEGLEEESRSSAHCWLTLDGEPYQERADTRGRFPTKLGSRDGLINYWIGPGKDRSIRCKVHDAR
jgi:Transglutaminase-like superfamily